ncbi:MAG: hypothetical protein BECKG1743D_GA0114223_102691 [Candidatus Kentron sp. G]|nr:MAG: hypothetical protein BECKG1743D_GA0114223_102691 [Candidatus Kentron sp. G]
MRMKPPKCDKVELGIKSCMQKSSCTPNIVKNSLEMLIYFHGNSAFSLPNFMTYRASLWDTI